MIQPRMLATLKAPATTLVSLVTALTAGGTVLLAYGPSTAEGGSTSFGDALFTAVSALTSTGLTVVNTAEHWTLFGKAVIAALFEVGSISMMTIATGTLLLVFPELGRRRRITTFDGNRLTSIDISRLAATVAAIAVGVQALGAFALTIRFWMVGEFGFGFAFRHGVFGSLSAFTNAGFTLNQNSMMQYATDWWVSGVVMAMSIVGALGVPVLLDIVDRRRAAGSWSPLTRASLAAHGALLSIGAALFALLEWSNHETLAPFGAPSRVLVASYQSVMVRSTGFASIDMTNLEEPSQLAATALMAIGGGIGSAAGGITVTAIGVIGAIALCQMRGRAPAVFGTPIPPAVCRAAGTMVILALTTIMAAAVAIAASTPEANAFDALFEASSAFGNVGWSLNLTPSLTGTGRVITMLTMIVGRILPLIVVATVAVTSPVDHIGGPAPTR